jgi:hypothetical protein
MKQPPPDGTTKGSILQNQSTVSVDTDIRRGFIKGITEDTHESD